MVLVCVHAHMHIGMLQHGTYDFHVCFFPSLVMAHHMDIVLHYITF